MDRTSKPERVVITLGKALFVSLVLFFLALPLVVVSGVSFNEKKALFFPPRGFSMRWYEELVTRSQWLEPIANSLIIAATAGVIAVSIALPISYALWARKTYWAKALYSIGLIPFMLPPVVSALGMLIFFSTMGVYGNIENDIIGHGIFLTTLPMMMISLGLESVDREQIEAASTLGANRKQVFFTIILPLIGPYVFAGYAFCFILSLNEYIIAFMVAGFTVETLPIKIFNSLRYGYTPVMGAVALVFLIIAAGLFSLVALFGDLLKLLGAYHRGS